MSCCQQLVVQEARPGTARVRVTDLSGPGLINPTPDKGPCESEAEVEPFDVSAKMVGSLQAFQTCLYHCCWYPFDPPFYLVELHTRHSFTSHLYSLWCSGEHVCPPARFTVPRSIGVVFPCDYSNKQVNLVFFLFFYTHVSVLVLCYHRNCCVGQEISRVWHHWTSALTLVKTLWDTVVNYPKNEMLYSICKLKTFCYNDQVKSSSRLG